MLAWHSVIEMSEKRNTDYLEYKDSTSVIVSEIKESCQLRDAFGFNYDNK